MSGGVIARTCFTLTGVSYLLHHDNWVENRGDVPWQSMSSPGGSLDYPPEINQWDDTREHCDGGECMQLKGQVLFC